ncbi:uncharacterized protein LOC142241154 [Haematobia irritans]|uniref:uncharacterized protein LOC142241154 n=1 Tax=Haematobia irritans TaxID=7368 RepID=UPI003F502ADD
MCTNEDTSSSFHVKYECEDSNFSSSYQQDEEPYDSQVGELTPIKTSDGSPSSIYLRHGNRLLFCSGKYFYIDHTTAHTEHQKEHTGIVCTCHTCGVKIKGSLKVSSNFICHLKNKHPEVYHEFLKHKTDNGLSFGRVSKKIYQQRYSPYSPMANVNVAQSNEKQEKFDQKVLQFLLATNQSFDVVENPNFLKLFEFVDSSLQIRNADYYERYVYNASEFKKQELCHMFNMTRIFMCNTFDLWSYKDATYIAISCHWIDDHFQRQTAFITCKRSFVHDDFKEVQANIFARFGLASAAVTATPAHNIQNFTEEFLLFGLSKESLVGKDNSLLEAMAGNLKFLSPNNENTIQLDILKLNKIWGRNFVSKLNDNLKVIHASVMDKCCSIWGNFESKEFKATFDTILNEPLVRPQMFSFSSIYESIKHIIANKDKLEQICHYLDKPSFSSQEIAYLEELLDIFEPLNAAFLFLDLPQNHYYGCVLPTLVTLKWKLTRLHNNNKLILLQETLALLKEELLKEFKDYYDLSDNKSEAILAALTYPPVKTRFLMGLKDNMNCLSFQPRNVLLKHGKDYHHQLEDQKPDINNPYALNGHMSKVYSTQSSEFFDFGDNTETVSEDTNLPHTLRLEIDTYLADADCTLLSLLKYPTLRRMFYRFNTCIPSPSSVLRMFPVEKILEKSSRLVSNELFENSLFFNYYYGSKDIV